MRTTLGWVSHFRWGEKCRVTHVWLRGGKVRSDGLCNFAPGFVALVFPGGLNGDANDTKNILKGLASARNPKRPAKTKKPHRKGRGQRAREEKEQEQETEQEEEEGA